jgi:phosphoglycerate dehydrogenase-like enzyme
VTVSAEDAKPSLLVLDDREGLVRGAPGASRLRQLCDVEFLDEPLGGSDADFSHIRLLMLIRERTKVSDAVLQRFPNLEAIFQTGGHAYHVDVPAASRRGIPVALTRHATAVTRAMPELTLLLAAACLRRLPEAQALVGSDAWRVPTGRTLAGRTLGILGLGRHGRNVARLGAALGMEVVAWARRGVGGQSDAAGFTVPLLPLDDLLAAADVLSIHLKLSDESRGLLGEKELRKMKPRSVLVNTARGPIVDESALVKVLASGPVAAAGLDVFGEEPLPADSPLIGLPNVVLTPHIGWQVEEVFEEFAALVAVQVEEFLRGTLARDQLCDPSIVLAPRARGGLGPDRPQ